MKEIKILQNVVQHEGRPDPWGGARREHGHYLIEDDTDTDWVETTATTGEVKLGTHPLEIGEKTGNYYWGNHLGIIEPKDDEISFLKSIYSIDEIDDGDHVVIPFGVGGLHSYLGLDGEPPKKWGSIFDFMSKDIIELIRNKNAYVLINYTQEGHIQHDDYKNLHDELDRQKIPADKIIFVASNLNGNEQYKSFCEKHKKLTTKKMNIIEMNHMLESSVEIYHQILDGDYNKKIDELYPHKQSFVSKEDLDEGRNTIREKYFLSYNRVIRQYRIALVSMIYEMGLQDKGIISLGAKGVDKMFGGTWPNEISEFISDSEQKTLVNNALKKVKPLYPIDADGDIDAEFLPEWGSGAVGQWSNFAPQYKRVYFNVVTESCYYEDCIYLSEKVFKPISQLIPFIYFTNPFAMKKLRELGYKTFHPWIDESYDEETNNDKRFFMILDEIKRLCSMSKEEIHKWYYEMEDILLHNQKYFSDYKRQDNINCWNTISDMIS